MTTIRYYFRQIFIMVLLTVFSSSYAADKPQKVITVTIPKFGRGLVETWIKKYTEAYPDVHVRIVEKNKGQADLEFVSETPEGDSGEHITYVGRYALLPVTTTENPLYERLSRKRFDEKDLKDLFFQKDILQKVGKNVRGFPVEGLTVYSGTSRISGRMLSPPISVVRLPSSAASVLRETTFIFSPPSTRTIPELPSIIWLTYLTFKIAV